MAAALDSGARRRTARRHLGAALGRHRAPPRPDHRRQRVPRPRRAAPGPAGPARRARGLPGCTTPRSSRRCATWPTPSDRRRPDGLPGHPRPGGRAHRPGVVRRQPVPGGRHRHRDRRCRDGPGGDRRRVRRHRHRGRLPVLQRPALRRARRGGGRRAEGRGGAQGLAGRKGRVRGRGRQPLRRLRRARRAPDDASTTWGWLDDSRLLRASSSARDRRRRPAGPAEDAVRGGRPVWETPEGIDVKPLYTAADLDGLDFLETYPGIAPVPARPVPDHVRQPAVDHPPVRRVLHRGGVQRLLPAQPGRRAEGPVGRLRPGHPPRLRLRPPAGRRRRRHGRAWRSTPSTTCGSCSTASRSTR